MKKRIISFLLTVCIFCTLVTGIVPIANASNAYVINGVTVHYDDFASSPNECWAYANNVYYKIWGQNFSSLFASSDNYLRNMPDTELTLTAAHLKAYVTNAALGSCLRICNSEYLHGSDGWGHSQIIVQKDASGFTVFEGGLTAAPHCREKYYTWSEYINTGWLGGTYSYIKYIKWPGCSPYSGNDTTTPGKPVLKDFSRSYSHGATVTFKWDNTINTTHYNLYIDKQNSDSTWQVDYQYWHYATSGVSTKLSDGVYRVLLQSTNSNADGWPYTNGDYITFVVGSHTHDKNVYMFYEADHPHCDCYECSICGEIWRDTTSSNELDNCYYCQRPGKPALSNFATSYVSGATIVFRWNSVPKATHYNLYIDKKNSDGSWQVDFKYWHYATSGLTTTLDTGTYRVLLQAYNSNFPGEDGTGWAYTNGDYITFAVTPANVTVTFDPNGGSVSPTTKTVTIGSTYGTLPTSTRTYYNFDGWYTSASGGSKVTASTMVTATTNHTLYAHWTHVCANGHNRAY